LTIIIFIYPTPIIYGESMGKKTILKNSMKKAQASMEYLMTYGWAIMVILVLVGVLYWTGVFQPRTPEICKFDAGISCAEYVLKPGTFELKLGQGTGKPIIVKKIACIDEVPIALEKKKEDSETGLNGKIGNKNPSKAHSFSKPKPASLSAGPPVCPNGMCEWWGFPPETAASCPADCWCGDGTCDASETSATCGLDCWCGDWVCSSNENPATCPNDCSCGDGICSNGENCPSDCVCGDGTCSWNENPTTCAGDCPDVCGDGLCTGAETKITCPVDCPPLCGDGDCDNPPENSANCPADCPIVGPVCGDGSCDGGETFATCPADCPAPPAPASGSVVWASIDDRCKNTNLNIQIGSGGDSKLSGTGAGQTIECCKGDTPVGPNDVGTQYKGDVVVVYEQNGFTYTKIADLVAEVEPRS